MPHSLRHMLAAGIAVFALAGAAVPIVNVASTPVRAQEGGSQGEAVKQVPVTQKQIDGLIAAQPQIVAAQPQGGGNSDQPDPKLQAKMEAIVKKNGFSSLDEYGSVSDSISIVLAGLDPETKKYVGPTALIKKQMAEVQADKGMKAKDKAEAVKQLKEAMASGDGAKPLPQNIDVVAKNYDKLAQLMQGGEGQ